MNQPEAVFFKYADTFESWLEENRESTDSIWINREGRVALRPCLAAGLPFRPLGPHSPHHVEHKQPHLDGQQGWQYRFRADDRTRTGDPHLGKVVLAITRPGPPRLRQAATEARAAGASDFIGVEHIFLAIIKTKRQFRPRS
jgi:hypothetical protein